MGLDNEQKIIIVQQRILQFENELYHHELNKSVAESLGNSTEEIDSAITHLTAIIQAHKEQLEILNNEIV